MPRWRLAPIAASISLLVAAHGLYAQVGRLDTELHGFGPASPSGNGASKPGPIPASSSSSAPLADDESDPLTLRRAYRIAPMPRGATAARLPMFIEADSISGETDVYTTAAGTARLRRGGMTLRADKIEHTSADNTAHADGNVRVDNLGNVYTGPKAQLQLDTSEGWFMSPTYRFARTGAGGHAERFDFLDEQHSVAVNATYTSCTPEDGAEPPWVLTTSRVRMDFANDVGTAEGAVVRFYGVPILGAPTMTFPLSEKRKSGWLPPSFDISNRNGFELELPYYWNIAPNYDATLTPVYATRRGPGMKSEVRYLEPNYNGSVDADLMPNDTEARRSRWFSHIRHLYNYDASTSARLDLMRVSDDDYWKDFSGSIPGLTTRLLSSQASLEHHLRASSFGLQSLGVQDLQVFGRIQSWQALQTTDSTTNYVSPYRRVPQVGLHGNGDAHGLLWEIDTQVNRFTQPDPGVINGARAHMVTSLAYPWQPIPGVIGWTITPRLSLNAASYALDQDTANGRRSFARTIPTFSLNSAWVLERPAQWFGRNYIETLEPRLQYQRTPYRDQSYIPQFDSAPLDFNADSIYADNSFSGIDRVADAHQVAAGVTGRLIDPSSGAEALRLGIVQRYLLSDQRITSDGQPLSERLSDLLLLGSTSVIRNWYLDSTLTYNDNTSKLERTTLTARYNPEPWHTVSMTYRATSGQNRQLDLGWQWPIAGRAPVTRTPASIVASLANAEQEAASASTKGASCSGGTWYSVGRLNYNLLDSRVTDSLLGIEYDGGCWIGRVVAERLSTGTATATTRLMFQLELVGLSRLGSSPLRALKENIPGYRLLREENSVIASPASPEPFVSTND